MSLSHSQPPVNVRATGPPPDLVPDPTCPECGTDDVFYYWDDTTEPVLVCCECVAFEAVDVD